MSRSEDLVRRRDAVVCPGVSRLSGLTAASAKGAIITDMDGREFIDFAGGIGVTPFLAWLEALQSTPARAPDVDFYYNVREHETDPFVARLEALCASLPAVRLHVISGARNERLTAATLRERSRAGTALEIWFCGPGGLARNLREGLRATGMGGVRFHQEAFEMR